MFVWYDTVAVALAGLCCVIYRTIQEYQQDYVMWYTIWYTIPCSYVVIVINRVILVITLGHSKM